MARLILSWGRSEKDYYYVLLCGAVDDVCLQYGEGTEGLVEPTVN